MSKKKETDKSAGKLDWHPAFLQAIKQELSDYKDSLEFKYQYQLTSEPLRIDLLIIKKPKQVKIDKNIARIFRTENILEYKSPDISLSVKDFLKVYAYANLYAAMTPKVKFSDLTITFIVTRHPREIIKYLEKARGYKVEETSLGIYQVTGDYVPIQIIETKKLSEDENLWLKSLTNDLEIRNLDAIIRNRQKSPGEAFPDAYFNILIRANPEVFLEVQKMANGAMTFEEVFTKAGIIPQWIERGIEQGIEQGIERGIERGIEQGKEKTALNLLAKGMPIEEIAQITELPIEKVRALGKGKKQKR